MAQTLHKSVERLILLTIHTPVLTNEVEQLGKDLAAMMQQTSDAVICVNLRNAELLPPHITQGYLAIMRADNAHLLRSAFWVSDAGLFGKQIERLVDEAGNPKRRICRTAAQVEACLAEVATPTEMEAVRQFLSA